MNNKTLMIAGIAIVVVLGGALFLMQKPSSVPNGSDAASGTQLEGTPVTSPDATTTETGNAMVATSTKTFAVDASPFKFSVAEMKVKKGDTVKVTVTNKSGMHDWVLDEFKVRTKQLAAGASETVTFVADKSGTFEYYCSVANHRSMGMVGKLIVE